MKVACIADPITAVGLKLAGVEETHETTDRKEAEKIFKELVGREDIGILIITEKMAQKMGKGVLELGREGEKMTPIVIEIPSKEGPIPERKEVIDDLVKRAVGIKVEG